MTVKESKLFEGNLWQRDCAAIIYGLQADVAALQAQLGANTIVSGVYTPTLTNVTNVTSSTGYQANYMRVGDMVTVSSKIDVTPTLIGTVTEVGLSLPIASAFTVNEDCGGAAASSSVASDCAAVLPDTVNDRARLRWISVGVSATNLFYVYMYRIK